jgi:cyanobactin cluster PatC/TenC/TruC protein
MSPQARKPRKPVAAPPADAKEPATKPTVDEAGRAAGTGGPEPPRAVPPAPPPQPTPPNRKPTAPTRLPVLETGLSHYGFWVEMFGDTENPPLPQGERRGRIWA